MTGSETPIPQPKPAASAADMERWESEKWMNEMDQKGKDEKGKCKLEKGEKNEVLCRNTL